jgi:hypothetical protein
LDYLPPLIRNLKFSVTYFDIHYSERLSQISDTYAALSNPLDAPFVQRNPTPAQVQTLVNTLGISTNNTGLPYDPATVAAIINGQTTNFTQQRIRGVDFSADYRHSLSIGLMELFLNTAYLKYEEQTVPTVPVAVISGTVFNPPRFRGRGGVTWGRGPWSATLLANYLGSESNTYEPGNPHVASWTTADASLSFAPSWSGAAKGLRINAAVQNLFNRDPPYAVYAGGYVHGVNYDPLNATPLGRFVTVGVAKSW